MKNETPEVVIPEVEVEVEKTPRDWKKIAKIGSVAALAVVAFAVGAASRKKDDNNVLDTDDYDPVEVSDD